MVEIKSITLGLENCEDLVLKKSVLGRFVIKDIDTKIADTVGKYSTAKTVAIEIFSEGNAEYESFGSHKETIFNRLQSFRDICSIDIQYKDGTKDSYSVDYNEDKFSEENLNEKVYLSKAGNLYIVIAKDKEVEDFFEIKEIDDINEMAKFKSMRDAGYDEPEKQEYKSDNLPELYRYVYLYGKDNQCALSVRVKDPDCGWKFIFEKEQNAIHFPIAWKYPTHRVEQFLKTHEQSLLMEDIKRKYPE